MSARQEHESQHWENQCSTVSMQYHDEWGRTGPGFPLRIKNPFSILTFSLLISFLKTSKEKKDNYLVGVCNHVRIIFSVINLTTTLRMAQIRCKGGWKVVKSDKRDTLKGVIWNQREVKNGRPLSEIEDCCYFLSVKFVKITLHAPDSDNFSQCPLHT